MKSLTSIDNIDDFSPAPNHRFKISLVILNNYIIRVSLTKNTKIGLLEKILGNQKYIFIYNGNIINHSSTCSMYNIKENDLIFAIPSEQTKIINKIKNPSTFLEKTSRYDKRKLSNMDEMMRIRDIRLSKAELKPKKMIKLQKNFLLNLEKKEKKQIKQVKIEKSFYEKPTEITHEPLPIFWKQT